MTMTRIAERGVRLMAKGLALGAAIMLLTGAQVVFAASNTAGSGSYVEKMQKWQNEMSEKFRDMYKALRGKSEQHAKSAAAASVDLREQNDSYVIRLSLPDRDLNKVEVTFSDGALSIVAPAEGKASRYEQTVQLSGVSSQPNLQVDRRQSDNMIVFTVPKRGIAGQPPGIVPDPALIPLQDWEHDILERMEGMRREMNRIFEDSFNEFRFTPGLQGAFDEPIFGSSVDLSEDGNNYVARAYLPRRDMNKVNVSVEGQTLKIEAKAEESGDHPEKGMIVSRQAQYSQMLTLPGPVKVDKMKVDRKEGLLVVTLPKA